MIERVVPIKRAAPLAEHVDIPLDVRRRTDSLSARMEKIRRVLTKPAALPEQKRAAKDELVALSQEALNLWSLL